MLCFALNFVVRNVLFGFGFWRRKLDGFLSTPKIRRSISAPLRPKCQSLPRKSLSGKSWGYVKVCNPSCPKKKNRLNYRSRAMSDSRRRFPWQTGFFYRLHRVTPPCHNRLKSSAQKRFKLQFLSNSFIESFFCFVQFLLTIIWLSKWVYLQFLLVLKFNRCPKIVFHIHLICLFIV